MYIRILITGLLLAGIAVNTAEAHFTDGEIYENTYGVHRLWINNKETMVFLAGSRKEKKIYLCRKEL